MLFKELYKFNNLKYNKIHFILGKNPTTSARSPLLWNYCFKKFKLKSVFIPVDIKKKDIKNFIYLFKKKKNYKSFLITNPYKEEILKYCDVLNSRVKLSGASNFVIKKNNTLFAYNTDCFGFYSAIRNYLNKSFYFVYGFGGVGKAIISELLYRNKKIYLFNRSKKKLSKLKKNKSISIVESNTFNDFLKKSEVFINASSVGNLSLKNLNLLKDNQVKYFRNKFIYDVNFKPEKSKLLLNADKHNIKNQNGKLMNLFQAIEAFKLSYPKFSKKKIFNTLKKLN